ncbi:MAG TPA: hypothetical protein VFP58_05850 [Candidatus Eisenbacteria bacterium]|nr:hypothetical protein [Candidatus Eisenbacteria bacterium]
MAPRAVLLASCLLAMTTGCAGTKPMGSPRTFTASPGARVALIPFEDLSGRVDVAESFTRVFLTSLVQSGTLDVLEPGLVEAAIEGLQIRSTAAMTSTELKALADTLGATHVLLGTVLDAGVVRTEEGELPSVAAALRLVEIRTQRVVWACHHAKTGEDHATVFGWGRERSRDRLLGALATEMMGQLKKSAVLETSTPSERSER